MSGGSPRTARSGGAQTTGGGTDATALGVADRALYALFSRHADRRRHAADRKRYRGTTVSRSFDVFLARVYAISWVVCVLTVAWTFGLTVAVPADLLADAFAFVRAGTPVFDSVPVPHVPRTYAAGALAVLVGALTKRTVVALGGRYLKWAASARRSNIERTLPGAVRYLRALSSGTDGGRTMLEKVASRPGTYGETAVSFRKVLNKAALTGSLDRGMRIVARDTPSRDALSPFLIKYREHAEQGTDALDGYLRMESRMLSHRQARAREQAQGFLELLAEMFIVLLVMPALLVIVLTVMSVLAPGLGRPVGPPFGALSLRAFIVYGSAAFILVVGAGAAALIGSLRPPNQRPPDHHLPAGALSVLRSAGTNPKSAALLAAPAALGLGWLLTSLAYRSLDVVLLTYVALALPVGMVALRRSRLDDAKDREIRDFVHAVSGHVGLGRPFSTAVELVARDVELGALSADVRDLAFNINLTTRDGELRSAALSQFTDRVGTPLADQTIGLVTGALDVGGDAEDVFETLQTEIGRLYHEKKALRANMLVYVAVGWTTALLVVGIMIAINVSVLDSFAQLSTVSGVDAGLALAPDAIEPARDRYRFYVVTQATMLSCGWFAGYASRGFYEALLHSAALVAVAYFIFTGAGMI